MTTDAIYLSMQYGERLKILWNATCAWAVDFGTWGYSMALSADASSLVTGSYFTPNVYLGKINSSDGAVLASYSTISISYYVYIYTRDTRALCIFADGWF